MKKPALLSTTEGIIDSNKELEANLCSIYVQDFVKFFNESRKLNDLIFYP